MKKKIRRFFMRLFEVKNRILYPEPDERGTYLHWTEKEFNFLCWLDDHGF